MGVGGVGFAVGGGEGGAYGGLGCGERVRVAVVGGHVGRSRWLVGGVWAQGGSARCADLAVACAVRCAARYLSREDGSGLVMKMQDDEGKIHHLCICGRELP